jgi:hypothetical protein
MRHVYTLLIIYCLSVNGDQVINDAHFWGHGISDKFIAGLICTYTMERLVDENSKAGKD